MAKGRKPSGRRRSASRAKASEVPPLRHGYSSSELVLGLVGAVGAELDKVQRALEDRLRVAGYQVDIVRISKDIIPLIQTVGEVGSATEYDRISRLMDAGNEARLLGGSNSILALGAAAFISTLRSDGSETEPPRKRAYIVTSLKHPEEVARLREIYPEGFYLIGVHADEDRRLRYLTDNKRIPRKNALHLMARDRDERMPHGQRVIDTFHLSDFFLRIDGDDDQLNLSLWRIVDLLFGDPFVTPTFDEYAMFMAFAASLRSADLSRQVGAVVAVDDQVLSTGANDCPRAGGGLYWPEKGPASQQVTDFPKGRDHTRGYDSNVKEQQSIISAIVKEAVANGVDRDVLEKTLAGSRIRDLTEFGRVVHAEMEAILSCGRAGISTTDATLYSTTFPCHNCAKHIVAAGIMRVVFIEPYQKSKAAEFHDDSIVVGFAPPAPLANKVRRVHFEPFVGVGPRRFFDLFSMRLGSGYPIRRKEDDGRKTQWELEIGRLRLQMLPVSYRDLELIASDMFTKAVEKKGESNDD